MCTNPKTHEERASMFDIERLRHFQVQVKAIVLACAADAWRK
jgi:hypothetical protein